MNNPLIAAAAVSEGAAVVKDNFKPIVLTALAAAGLYFGPKLYRNWRASVYARKNAGSPALVAASIIYNSFTRFEFPGTLGWILPDIDFSTNENALYDIARQVGSYKEVSDAYYILFGRTLDKDIQNGLDTEEMQTFYSILKSQQLSTDTTVYQNGTTVYCAVKAGMQVGQVERTQNTWVPNGELYDNFQFNETVGKVVDTGIVQPGDANGNDGKRFYIIEDCLAFGVWCKYGVVLQEQILNKKL